MFNTFKTSICDILSDNGITVYNQYSDDIDLIKNQICHTGFICIKGVEKVCSYQCNSNVKSSEVLIDAECKIIAGKGTAADSFSELIEKVYMDFIFSETALPVSIKLGELKVNSLCSRFETDIFLKFKCFISEAAPED